MFMVYKIVCLCLFRLVAGYYSSRLYKTLRGQQWKKAAFMVTCLFFDVPTSEALFFVLRPIIPQLLILLKYLSYGKQLVKLTLRLPSAGDPARNFL